MKPRHLALTLIAFMTAPMTILHAAERNPNVIFILTDDQGWNDAHSRHRALPGHVTSGKRDDVSVTGGVGFLPTICKLTFPQHAKTLAELRTLLAGKLPPITP